MIDYVLLLALIISLITDLRSRRILNIVTLPAIFFALIYHFITGGWDGLMFSGKGFLVGLLLLLIPFMLGGMGAGDVKLLAVIGSLKGTIFVFQSFLFMALVGGILALGVLIIKKQLRITWKRGLVSLGLLRLDAQASIQMMDRQELHTSLPYAVPIVLGTLSSYLWSGY